MTSVPSYTDYSGTPTGDYWENFLAGWDDYSSGAEGFDYVVAGDTAIINIPNDFNLVNFQDNSIYHPVVGAATTVIFTGVERSNLRDASIEIEHFTFFSDEEIDHYIFI